MGFNVIQTNLLTIPSAVLGALTLLIFCYMSEIINSRTTAGLVLQVWMLPLLIGLLNFTKTTSKWAGFAIYSLIVGFPDIHPVQVAWISTNSQSVGVRTVSASLYNMFVQAGSIAAVSHRLICEACKLCADAYSLQANIYQNSDKPLCMTSSPSLTIVHVSHIYPFIQISTATVC